jgi:hypothetical protein
MVVHDLVCCVPQAGEPDAGVTIVMHGGAIFGYRSLIERIPSKHELIVLLDNSDNPKIREIARDIRKTLLPTGYR